MSNFLINKLKNTFQREGFSGLIRKSTRRIKSFYLRKRFNNSQNINRWSTLQNKFEGETVFLIGNGPSLNKTPLYFLKNEFTMCCNRFYIINERINWTPTFYMTTDNLVLSDSLDEINSFIPQTQISFFPDIHFRGDKFIDKIENHGNVYWIQQLFGEGFSINLPKVYPGGTVIYEGLQILNYLGFKKIYLIGVDMNYQIHKTAKYLNKRSVDIESQDDDDPNHFDPRYFGKNSKYHQPEGFVIRDILKNLKYLSGLTTDLNIEIINAGFDSKVDFFPKTNFENIFDFNEEIKGQLFNECLIKNSNYKSVSEFESKNSKISGTVSEIEDLLDFYTSKEVGLKIINKSIFTHVPLGPFREKYYFIKRKKINE